MKEDCQLYLNGEMRYRKGGFTLIELLVVIGIIALLLAILAPALAKSKELTRRVICAARLQQITYAMNVYSQSYNDYLPRFDMTDFPVYLHNVERTYTNFMEENYGFTDYDFFCPSISKRKVENILNDWKPFNGIVIGYFLWVPRLDWKGRQCPPNHDDLSYPYLLDPKPFRGPVKITESLVKTNPVMTDQVSTKVGNPVNIDLSKEKDVTGGGNCHRWNQVIDMTNQSFADGHVEQRKGSELKARFGTSNGFYWQWR